MIESLCLIQRNFTCACKFILFSGLFDYDLTDLKALPDDTKVHIRSEIESIVAQALNVESTVKETGIHVELV